MGTDGMDASGLADLAGDALTKGGGMVYTSVAGPASAYPKAAKFAADFKAKFGADPQPFAAQAYDSANICLLAIEAAAKAAGGEVPTREAVRDAVRQVKLDGLTGSISFDSIGDLPVAKYFIIRVNATTGAEWNKNEIVAELEFASPGMGE
jgi:branched-chain amino acid transport system substrate-binding protein